jgi:signal transduction histidine kinase
MANLSVQGMAYVAGDGRIVIARWRDLSTGADVPALRTALAATIARTDLTRVVGQGSSGRFYARLGDTVAAIGVAQVRRSDGTGRPRGWVLMARTLTSAQMSELLQVGARVDPAAGTVARGPAIEPGRSTVAISVPILGPDRRPVAATRFQVPRDVSLLGRRMLLLAVAGSSVLLLLVLAVLRQLIGRLVLAPLRRVETHMQRVRASGSLTLLADEGRADEIGSLGRSFNAMLRQLKDLREQIEVQSFALGRSESAVAVMHNVRNALNPISTILSQGVQQAPSVDRAMLDRALGELAKDDVPAPRREKLAAFVAAGIAAEAQARAHHKGELEVGREAMAHVLEIIGQQQKHAHERPELERVDITELVQKNAAIARYTDDRSVAVSVPTRPYHVLASRVILSQVIGNLFGNAAEAIAAAGVAAGRITVSVEEAGGQVVVRVADNGEGFDPANAPSLFQRGFSTRAHKSGGLGLHWCANSMTAMEGTLALESEGKGHGATAVLTLKAPVPVERAEAA